MDDYQKSILNYLKIYFVELNFEIILQDKKIEAITMLLKALPASEIEDLVNLIDSDDLKHKILLKLSMS